MGAEGVSRRNSDCESLRQKDSEVEKDSVSVRITHIALKSEHIVHGILINRISWTFLYQVFLLVHERVCIKMQKKNKRRRKKKWKL